MALVCELDDQESFVGSKARQHWLWFAYDTKTGGVLAYTYGPRTDETSRERLILLTPFNIGMISSDDWGSYGRRWQRISIWPVKYSPNGLSVIT